MSYYERQYKPRFTKPEAGNPYYNTPDAGGYAVGIIKGSPLDAGCNVLANCVGYAAARFNEIIGAGEFKYFKYAPNAEDFYDFGIAQGLKVGSEPKLGAIICWAKGKTHTSGDGAGHVAVVEQINEDGSIITSESGYGCASPFWTTTRKKGSGNWGAGSEYRFLGFIYNPAVSESSEPSGSEDDSKEDEGGTTMKVWNGIDVSKYQGDVDWKKVKASGVQFAILRAGYGRMKSQKDPKFESYYASCKEQGIPVGCYWYSYATDPEGARKEAQVCLEVIKGKKFEYPIYFDVEEKKQFALGKEAVTAIIKAFLETVEAAGYWVGLYMSSYFLENFVSEEVRNRYAVWVAHYDVEKPTYKGQYGMWQKSGSGKVDGISVAVDLDECYQDYPALIKAKGLNGLGKDGGKVPESQKPPEYTTYKVKTGDTLWGIARRFLGNGNRYPEIMYANGLTSTMIYSGQTLKIPKK